MTFTTLLDALSTAALDTLAGFDKQAALDAGLQPSKVRDWEQLHELYYGETTSPQNQRLCVDHARRNRLSLDQLVMIERLLQPISNARTRMKLRLAILARCGNYRTLMAAAKALIPKQDPPPRKQLTFTRSRKGRRTMTVTADERDLADLEHVLSRELDPDAPIAQQMLARFLTLMRDGAGAGIPHAVPRPVVVVPVDALAKIVRGAGDDVVLGLSDGTTITGAEYLQRFLAGAGCGLEAALFHPAQGAVNLYREQRRANSKQRDLARLTLTVCPVPGCRQPADNCEVHHMTAWSRGGETNMANLAPVCRYHNRVNDDDPDKPSRGRIERVRGTPTWVSPRGYPVANTTHPYGAMQVLFGGGA